jgi:uncharacterized protein (DUF1800 family)
MAGLLDPMTAANGWTRAQARHLLNRAGFGVSAARLDRLATLSVTAAVDELVNFEAVPDNLVEPDWLTGWKEEDALRARFSDREKREEAFRELRREQRAQIDRLKHWWLGQMRATSRPLQEKLALFWHGHFATSAEKVRIPLANWQLNQVFRTHAAGNFRTMVFEVGKSPAMLQYLDNERNRKAKPNENWARELMELFTMGIGNYTEQDIKEAARAFTGYKHNKGEFVFDERNHDFGPKTFLGRTGELDGRDVIETIMEQPVTARFIAGKLWNYFAGVPGNEEIVSGLAATLRENDYELKPMLRQMFLSRAFYSEPVMAGQIKSPAQFLVMLLDELDRPMPARQVTSPLMRALGQDLLQPPNVKGWEGNRAWINSNTLLLRYNVPAFLLLGTQLELNPVPQLDDMMGDDSMMMMDGGADRKPRRDQLAYTVAREAIKDFRALMAPYRGKGPGEVVDMMAERHLGRRLEPRQRNTLMDVLGGASGRALTERELVVRGPQALHLLLSTAEYQLC